MNVRSIGAVICLVLGALLTIPATIAIWEERTVLDEDEFVATVEEVFQDDEVQNAVALRATDAVMVELEIEDRIDTAINDFGDSDRFGNLPGLTPLEGPLVQLARDAIYRACVRILNSDALAAVLSTTLRTTHRAVTALIENDSAYLDLNGDQVVLNLRPLIGEVILQVGGERALEAAEARADEDFGRIVLVEDRNDMVWTLVGFVDNFHPVVPLLALFFLALAILLAHDRLRMVGRIGVFLVVVSGLVLLALAVPLKELATGWPPRAEGQAAAEATYDILLDNFRNQQVFLAVLGIALVAVSAIAREPIALAAIRRVQPGGASRADDVPSVRKWARERATALRAAGLGVAALLLVLWPDPSQRVFITIVLTAVVYFGLLYVVISDASFAFSMRNHIRNFFDPTGGLQPGDQPTFVGRWAGLLRLVGLLVSLAAVVFVPEISYKALLFIVAATLSYLAAIDYFASRRPDTGTHEV